MDLIFISCAFLAGFVALKCHLPPLVGFLVTGFILHYFGYESNQMITTLADLGVTLLLFSIGLKLDIKTLLAKEVWAGATLHNLLCTLMFAAALLALQYLGLHSLSGLGIPQLLIIGFALSFSSTVFAVKSLQEKGEMNAIYGTLAIGILVMQDIFAVIFLSASTGKLPHWYAVALFLLPFIRPVFYKLLDWVGHGEMLVLFGIFFALVMGAGLFQIVGLKPDLGAIILGMLLSDHSKASELSKSLFNLKELFLVCFFLNIGLSAQPTLTGLLLALVLIVLLPLKGVLYFWVLNRFHFRVRTTLLASLSLFNYSEFGLIVGGLAYHQGWLPGDILVTIAIAVPISFIVAAPIGKKGHELYRRASHWLKPQLAETLNPKDKLINPGNAQVLILGMGRIGTGAYDELYSRHGNICLGIELKEESVAQQREEGRNVINGDATDPDFWERILDKDRVKLILLAMPHNQGNKVALDLLQQNNFNGQIAAIAEYNDQKEDMLNSGAHAAFNIYSEAGTGFARHVCQQLKPKFEPSSTK
ncbi:MULTISPECIES: cation:proton antiporter family protein [Vibrio]|uniref:Potassium transporter Kef n=2 Tax=Vibrio TaxID=662 RepID=A0A7X4LKP2_9VIBR|nr:MULTISPECIES: cation:proton antiporter family protein [Vibrio]MBF8999820.1 cation:proton antiporter [Vibrio nitrifigilis]MZI93402.1 potassium transporter Kef [Vibrio eleionomae]